jgi:hypothetical protein
MCGSKTGSFFHANSNVLFIRPFYLLLAIFPGRNWSFRVKTKRERERERETRSEVLESTYGTLPAAVMLFYLSGQ